MKMASEKDGKRGKLVGEGRRKLKGRRKGRRFAREAMKDGSKA